jgi:SAM-dependent methyltransferase
VSLSCQIDWYEGDFGGQNLTDLGILRTLLITASPWTDRSSFSGCDTRDFKHSAEYHPGVTGADRRFLEYLLARRLLLSPVLELGSREIADQGGNTREAVMAAGLEWEGADIEDGPGVDWKIDLLDDHSVDAVDRRWGTVVLFNILEHLYDPAAALRNAVKLLAPAGRTAIITPTVWQLHDFPADYWRPLPDFYIEFARRNGLAIVEEGFHWILADKDLSVGELVVGSQKLLPARFPLGDRVFSRREVQISRVVNRAFSSLGRKVVFPYSALGVLLETKSAS